MTRPDPNQPEPTPATLCPDDAAVLDALLEARAAGAENGPLPPGAAERAPRLRKLLGLLDHADAQHDQQITDAHLDELTTRTLDAVHEQRQRQRFAQQVAIFAEPRRTMGVAWRQVMTAAAVFLIGLSLLLPVLNKVDADAKRTQCASNLQAVGAGFGSFAEQHQGQMPRYAQQAPAWWRVGQGDAQRPVASNSANLYLLVRGGFVQADLLNCPANEHAPEKGEMTARDFDYPSHQAVSFSYQNQSGQPIRFDQVAAVAILADKNPLFVIKPGQFATRVDLTTAAPSVVHGKRGQNVLVGNGSVTWTVRPIMQRADDGEADNIWTVRGITTYSGDETPADPQDSFLVP
jgi:hypothetical protein